MRPKSRKAIDDYLSELMNGSQAKVQKLPGRGRGLIAVQTPSGEPPILFGDEPLGRIVQTAFKAQSGCACSLCGHALGSSEHYLRKLLKSRALSSQSSITALSLEDSMLTDPVSDILSGPPLFIKGRRPLFCSRQCLDEHERIFAPVRKGLIAARKFAQHARKCDCVFYMLAFKLICWVIAEWKRTGNAIRSAASVKVLYSQFYWDSVDVPADETSCASFRSQLQRETDQSRLLARDALESVLPLPPGWDFLEKDGYSKLLGALCCNAIAVVYAPPVVQQVLQVDAMVENAAKRKAVGVLEPWIRELLSSPLARDDSDSDFEGQEKDEKELSWETKNGPLRFSTALFPAYKGYAIFPRLALANHSCDPSCAVEFTFAGTLFLMAQRGNHVQPGCELTISYLDASLGAKVSLDREDTVRRRRLLRPYGFECMCSSCKQYGAVEIQSGNSISKVTVKVQKKRKLRKDTTTLQTWESSSLSQVVQQKNPAELVQECLTHEEEEEEETVAAEVCIACDGTGEMLMETCPVCGGGGSSNGSDSMSRKWQRVF